jgi:hypothetical protein
MGRHDGRSDHNAAAIASRTACANSASLCVDIHFFAESADGPPTATLEPHPSIFLAAHDAADHLVLSNMRNCTPTSANHHAAVATADTGTPPTAAAGANELR